MSWRPWPPALLFIGVAAHLRVWLKSAPGSRTAFSRQALKQALLDTFLGRTVFKGDGRPASCIYSILGICHSVYRHVVAGHT